MTAQDEGARIGLSYDDEDDATPAPVEATPAPEVASELVAPAPEPVGETQEAAPPSAPTPVNVHAKRRTRAVAVVAVGFLATIGWLSQQSSDPVSLTPTAVSPEAASPEAAEAKAVSDEVALILTEDLARAAEHFATVGTYRGFAPTAPVTGAAGDTAIVLVLDSSAGCFFTGLAPGFNGAVKSDPTGLNCDPAELAIVQAELDAS